jgi:hypothetical protein
VCRCVGVWGADADGVGGGGGVGDIDAEADVDADAGGGATTDTASDTAADKSRLNFARDWAWEVYMY